MIIFIYIGYYFLWWLRRCSFVEGHVDNCVFMITLTNDNKDVPGYFLCEKSDGTKYRKDNDEDVAEDGIEQ